VESCELDPSQDKDQWWGHVETMMNFRLLKKARSFLISQVVVPF